MLRMEVHCYVCGFFSINNGSVKVIQKTCLLAFKDVIFEFDFADITVEFSILKSFSHNELLVDNNFHLNRSNRQSCELVFCVFEKGRRFSSLLSFRILLKIPRFITLLPLSSLTRRVIFQEFI